MIQQHIRFKHHCLITFGEFVQVFGIDWFDTGDIEGHYTPKRILQGLILTKRLESIKLFNLILSLCQIPWNVAVNLNLQYRRVIKDQDASGGAEAALRHISSLFCIYTQCHSLSQQRRNERLLIRSHGRTPVKSSPRDVTDIFRLDLRRTFGIINVLLIPSSSVGRADGC